MTDKNTGLQVVVEGNFDKEDIVKVAMAKIEEHLHSKIKQAKARLEINAKALNANTVRAAKVIENFVKSYEHHRVAEAMRESLSDFKDLCVTVSAVGQPLIPHDKKKYAIGIRVNVMPQGRPRDEESRASGQLALTIGKYEVLPEEYQSLMKAQQDLSDERSKTEAEIIEAKRQLNQFPSLERRVTAKIIENRLNKTADGRELVELMTRDLEGDLLALTNG
jgi:hypothetical protein